MLFVIPIIIYKYLTCDFYHICLIKRYLLITIDESHIIQFLANCFSDPHFIIIASGLNIELYIFNKEITSSNAR